MTKEKIKNLLESIFLVLAFGVIFSTCGFLLRCSIIEDRMEIRLRDKIKTAKTLNCKTSDVSIKYKTRIEASDASRVWEAVYSGNVFECTNTKTHNSCNKGDDCDNTYVTNVICVKK